MIDDQTPRWLAIANSRTGDAARDPHHPSITWGNRESLTRATTRAELVELYETLYAELAESLVGYKERIEDLEGVTRTQEREVQDLASQNRDLRDANNKASRRIRALLGLIDEAHGELA